MNGSICPIIPLCVGSAKRTWIPKQFRIETSEPSRSATAGLSPSEELTSKVVAIDVGNKITLSGSEPDHRNEAAYH